MNKGKDLSFNYTSVIIVIGLMNGLMPFATDLYLPAFSSMAISLDTTAGYIALTMSSFFLGSCFGQLLSGPLLDKFGRKWPMISGLVLFLVTSALCGFAQYVELLIILRIFQAIGISMCNVGGKAVVRDIFPPSDTAKIFSILGLIMGISPIIAPTVGGLILQSWGWRSIFFSLSVFAFIIIVLICFVLPETYQRDKKYAFTLGNIWSKYKTVIQNKEYLGYSFVTAMASAVLFSWISSSSYVFIDLLGVTEGQFGLVFAATASCLLIGNQANIFLLNRFESRDIALFAIIMMLIMCGIMIYIVQYNFEVIPMVVGMCFLIMFLHLISTNTMAIGLNSIEKDLGVASAFMGSLRMALSAVATLILSFFLNGSALPMIVMIAVISTLSLGLQYRLRKTF